MFLHEELYKLFLHSEELSTKNILTRWQEIHITYTEWTNQKYICYGNSIMHLLELNVLFVIQIEMYLHVFISYDFLRWQLMDLKIYWLKIVNRQSIKHQIGTKHSWICNTSQIHFMKNRRLSLLETYASVYTTLKKMCSYIFVTKHQTVLIFSKLKNASLRFLISSYHLFKIWKSCVMFESNITIDEYYSMETCCATWNNGKYINSNHRFLKYTYNPNKINIHCIVLLKTFYWHIYQC